jgi:hypothetical protein
MLRVYHIRGCTLVVKRILPPEEHSSLLDLNLMVLVQQSNWRGMCSFALVGRVELKGSSSKFLLNFSEGDKQFLNALSG